jgi:hypothetical protein
MNYFHNVASRGLILNQSMLVETMTTSLFSEICVLCGCFGSVVNHG